MKNKKLIQTAVLSLVTEMEKVNLRAGYLLENKFKVTAPVSLLENSEDVALYEEIVLEGIFDKIKSFFSGTKLPTLTPDEKSTVDSLREKVQTGMKKVSELSKVSIEDPTKLGMALEDMVKVAEEVKQAADAFEAAFEKIDPETQQEIQGLVPQLMKAKMSLFGSVAFKLTEIRKEVTDALQSLVSFIPSGQLSHALELARSSYKPEVPMLSASDMAKGIADLEGGSTRTPGGVSMG